MNLKTLKQETEAAVNAIQAAQSTVTLMEGDGLNAVTAGRVYEKLQGAKEALQANYRAQLERFQAAATGGA